MSRVTRKEIALFYIVWLHNTLYLISFWSQWFSIVAFHRPFQGALWKEIKGEKGYCLIKFDVAF